MKKLLLFTVIAVMNAYSGNGVKDYSIEEIAPKVRYTFFEEVHNYVSRRTFAFIKDNSCHGFEGPYINIQEYQDQQIQKQQIQEQQNKLDYHELQAKLKLEVKPMLIKNNKVIIQSVNMIKNELKGRE